MKDSYISPLVILVILCSCNSTDNRRAKTLNDCPQVATLQIKKRGFPLGRRYESFKK